MSDDAAVLRRARDLAKREGKSVIEPAHIRRAERELGHTLKVKN